MATPRSTSSKSRRTTSARSSAARAASSEDSAPSSKPPPPAKALESTSTSSDLLVIAQVLSAHGIRGELKCRLITDFPKQRFKRGNTVQIRGASHVVRSARVQGQVVLLALEDVTDRDTAESFRGADVELSQEQAHALPKGQFYWHQVIGLGVIDVTTG